MAAWNNSTATELTAVTAADAQPDLAIVRGNHAEHLFDLIQVVGVLLVTWRLVPLDACRIVTKAGGFGDDRALVDAVRYLRGQPISTTSPR